MQGSKVYRTAPTLGWLTASIYHRPNESVTKSHTFCRSRACRLSSTEQRFSPLTDIVIVRPFSSLTDTVIDCTVFLISQRHRYWLHVISHLSSTLSLCVLSRLSLTLSLTVQYFSSLSDIVIDCALFLISHRHCHCASFLTSQRHWHWLCNISHLSPILSLAVQHFSSRWHCHWLLNISHLSRALALTVRHFSSLNDQ